MAHPVTSILTDLSEFPFHLRKPAAFPRLADSVQYNSTGPEPRTGVDYRVELDIYNGPLDLLLYLIKRDELDIYDIPISKITDSYLGYMNMIRDMKSREGLDINVAGEFLVMAATLMEIKSGTLLPKAESANPKEGVTAASRNDPKLRPREDDSTARASEDNAKQQMSPSDYLQEALRPVAAGEERIQGVFLRLECDNGKGIAYFIIQAADRTYKIRAASLAQVQLTAYTQVTGDVTCGARKAPENSVLTFRPTKDPKDVKAKIDGDAIALEIVPKDFQLKK